MITFGRQVCGDLASASTREWLVTDGLGGYAMGTVAGLRTRRYHGLLVVAAPGASSRMLGLAALDPVVRAGDRVFRLATDEWAGGAVDPAGHIHLAEFRIEDGVPCWRWDLGDVVLEREIAMAHGRPAVGVVFRVLRAPGPITLELTPLCTWRDAHGERHGDIEPRMIPVADGFEFDGAYRVTGPNWQPGGEWYRGVHARAEAARGLNPDEDLWAAGWFTASLAPGASVGVTAAAAPYGGVLPSADALVATARSRARALCRGAGASDAVGRQLAIAADQFVIDTPTGPSAAAGYPWFGEWSRDLMTSFEGLFLTTGRLDEARRVLLRAGATVSEGMLANTADTGTLEYNTADAALWFLRAIDRYCAASGDLDTVAELADSMDAVLTHHQRGTRYGIAADPADGLLTQGKPGFALTWMDARIGGDPVTERQGKAVEINALWISGLATTAALFDRVRRPNDWASAAARAAASFGRRFPARTASASTTSSTAPPATTRPCARTSSWPSRCRTCRRPTRGRSSSAAPRCSPPSARAHWPRSHRRTRAATRAPGRPRPRLPPGHRLALADRPVCRRRPTRRRRRHRCPGRPGAAPRRVGPGLGVGDRGRRRPAHRDRLPVPGLVGRRTDPRPSRRALTCWGFVNLAGGD
ncbi:hypothetical protein GCM10027610_022180 [Dactylosporangium cerinum]